MTRQDEAPQRQRHRQPRKSLVPTRDGSKRVGAVDHGACYRRVPNPSASSLFLLVAAIVVSSMIDDGVARMKGTGFGVLAAPCVTENTTAWGGAEGERGGPIKVDVTATANLDLTSIFSCEGGDFEVVWSGAVNISGTIHIGLGTTVRIVGDSSPKDTTAGTSTSTASSGSNRSSSSIAGGSGNWSSSSQDEVDGLTVTLSIPRGLTSAVVGIGSSEISEATDKSIAFGPIFFVDGGQLSLENMAVRGGFVVNSTSTQTPSGAGIHAQSSNVTVTRCEFEDNFAELWGGGLYGNRSKLVVVDSVFRRCRAGFQVAPDEDVVDFAGGGIRVELSDVLVDGCLFENCYAGKKGGGMHQGIGRVSVLGSVFYNNTAGSGNVDDETEVGEGAALSFTSCTLSFDGKSSCGVNDTVFAKSHVGRKGGAVAIGSGDAPSHVEFHRCTVANSTTGRHTEDDPQGAGGAFAVGKGITLVLSDCVLSGNYCGNKGGVITLSSGENWGEKPGATLILRNSTFESNKADSDSGGVVYLDKFCSLTVAGDGNVFADNTCREDGAVFGATVNTNITVEGGVFRDNVAKQNGGVVWTKGHIEVLGGEFLGNEASDTGGVIISADDSTTILAGGVFEGNRAFDGGVVYVGEGSDLWVKGGQVSSNTAGNSGGAFAVSEGGHIQITGGNFTLNKADFGGFLLKEGAGTASCDGASIERNKGVNGGAIYAVEEAVVEWACDLKENEALAGPAIYARDKTTVELRGVSVLDNVVARGSAVFVVNSNLTTYQVHFKDTTKSSDLSAVQVDGGSTYMAEDTSFEGFAGEAVVFSEGELFLDDCDFSGSTASQLVYAEPHSTVVIRNTVLGDNNYLPLAKASSLAGELPTADSLTNANTTCRDRGGQASQDDTSSSPSSPSTSSSDVSPKNSSSPCSEGSVCLEGDLGVYCQCYLQRSTSKQRCVNGDAAALNLTTQNEPGTMFFPEMLEGDLLLSHVAHSSSSAASDRSITVSNATGSSTSSVVSSRSETSASSIEPNSSSSSITNTSSSSGGDGDGSGDVTHGGGQFGVVWSVAAPKSSVSGTSMMDWTVFPSTGLLLPGESITLRVVTLPSTSFDGTASVTFKATGVGSDSTTTPIPSRTTLTKGANSYHVQDDSNLLDQETYYHYHGAATAQQAQQLTSGTSPSASQHSNESSLLKDVSGWGSNAKGSASFNVTFYHCATGQAWSPTASSSLDCSEGDTCASCQLCSDVVKKEPEGVNCAEPGATLQTLPVKEGYWRAALDVAYIHGCSNEDACKGGSTVTSVQDYCHEGYMGPECTVCAPGYGRGAANHCHRCTTSFKAGMYFVITTAAVCALVVMALLAVYLVGGRGAVSSTVAGTKDSVRVLQRRTAVLLSRSDLGGRIDFTSPARAGGTRSSGVSGDGKEVPRRFRVRRSSVRGSRSTSSSGGGGGSEIDQDGDRRLEGGPGMRGPGGSLFPAKNNVRGLVVTPGWPGSRINQDGLATMVPERYSGSPSLPPLPAGGTWEAVLQGRIDRDNPESCCKPTRHHAYPSGTVRQLTSQQSVKRAYEGPPTTRAAGIERSTGNTEQPHLSVQRAEGGRETGVGVRGSGRNTEQAQSSEKHRAREADRDGTAAAKIGNKLAELPLSKIKIVIVVWQISSAFSNITNVAYPPIYEKFLSIIGVFTLDLAWILSASCLTTDVDFYDKLLMVTIGPLIFLGLLVVTFHIGARSRPVRPVATDAPISRNRRGGTQPAIGALQTTEPPTSGLALGKGRTSGTNPEDTSETVELPMSGPVLLRGRTSGMSGDTIALSPSERQTRRPGTSTVQHCSAAATYPHTLVLSRSERPARRAGASALQHRAAGGGELERESSGGQNTSANLDDATVNRSDSATMQTWSEGVVNSGANRPASPGPVERSSGRSQRSLMSVWKAGPGNVADPGQDHLWELFARHTTMTLILLYLIYSQVSTVVFQTFVCEKFPEISKSYLRADQRIECNTSTHMAYSTYAAVMIFLYPLGIPAAFYFLLWRQGSSINPPIHKYLKEQRGTQYVVQEKINQRSKDLGIAPTSFLWNAYYPNRYYFEVFECLRRLVLTGLLVFLVPDTPGQVAFSCVFAFVSLLAFELQRPHIDALEVQLYRTGCLVIFFTNFLALMIKAEVADENSAGSALYAVVLILVNIMFFLSIWWETWATMRATFSRRGFQGMVVGADVVGEDAVDRFMGPNRKRMRQKASHEGDGAEVNTQPAEDLPNLGRETRRHGSVCRQRHPHQVGEDAAPAGNRGHIGRSTELPFII